MHLCTLLTVTCACVVLYRYITILKRTIITIVFAHCNACLQFLIAVLEGMPDDCWVVRAGIHSTADLPVSVTSQYLASIFHAVSQMLAVGHGVVLPTRDAEYLTFVISLVLGANLYAVFVGTLISVIEDANGSHREYCKRTDMLQTWMAQRQLPRPLRRKLETYYEILFPGGHAFDDEQILASLSVPLVEEVSRHKCARLLQQLEIDWQSSPGLARRLSLVLDRQVFVGGDIVIYEGQRTVGMFFIIAGSVSVHKGSVVLRKLHANEGFTSIFGEMALFAASSRANATVSVPLHAYCDTFLLRAECFRDLYRAYPGFVDRLDRVRLGRERENRENGHGSDAPSSQMEEHAARESGGALGGASSMGQGTTSDSALHASSSPHASRPSPLGARADSISRSGSPAGYRKGSDVGMSTAPQLDANGRTATSRSPAAMRACAALDA